MEITFIDGERKRTVCFTDIESVVQDGKRLIVKDIEGWTGVVFLRGEAGVIVTGCDLDK